MSDRKAQLLERLNATHQDEPLWSVTVLVAGNKPETYHVRAAREGVAKTHAMMVYRQDMSGQGAEYVVVRVG